MKLATLRTLNSNKVARAVAQYVQFVAISQMASAIPRLPNAEKMADRSVPAQLVVNKFNDNMVTFWTVTQYLSDTHDVVIDVETLCAKAVVKKITAVKPEELKALAEATGLSVADVTAKRQATFAKALAQESANYKSLLDRVNGSEFCGGEFDELEVSATVAHDKCVEVASWIATWDKPDYAELVLIKADRLTLEKLALIEEQSKEGAPDYEELGGAPEDHATSSQMRQALLAARATEE
jgi:hypothetical protein